MTDQTTFPDLLERYDGFLLDAYGVLVNTTGAVPGAAKALDMLDRRDKAWCIVTNDASKLPETSADRYGEFLGRTIDPARIITAGSLLKPWAEQSGWKGARTHVLGPADSNEYARRAGLELSPADAAEVFVIGDESGFDLLPGLDEVLSVLIRRIESGRTFALVCPNDDVIYPKGDGGFGIAAGGLAALLERCLDARFPQTKYRFERLGKPRPLMFQEGLELLGQPPSGGLGLPSSDGCVMIGDTPKTDVVGANGVRLDVALFGDAQVDPKKKEEAPTWRLLTW